LFRALIEDFLLTYHQNLEPESFEQKGKRTYLKPEEKLKLILEVNRLFKRKVPYKRRNFSKITTIRTITKEEPIKLAQYITLEEISQFMNQWKEFIKLGYSEFLYEIIYTNLVPNPNPCQAKICEGFVFLLNGEYGTFLS